MTEVEIYTFLRQVFAEVFNRDDIDVHPALTAKDVVGWDSFRQVEINLALEEKFNIEIPFNANDPNSAGISFETAGDVIDAVTKVVAEQKGTP